MSKDEEAIDLAQRHYEVELGLSEIIRFTNTAEVERTWNEPIKLLEVNENTIESGILPIYFGPAPESGIHFPSVIIEVTPEEYRKIQSNELQLPDGWRFSAPIPRPAATANP
jgi:hypothetical protein